MLDVSSMYKCTNVLSILLKLKKIFKSDRENFQARCGLRTTFLPFAVFCCTVYYFCFSSISPTSSLFFKYALSVDCSCIFIFCFLFPCNWILFSWNCSSILLWVDVFWGQNNHNNPCRYGSQKLLKHLNRMAFADSVLLIWWSNSLWYRH